MIDTYAEATRHVDQGLSLTLFFPDTATTRDINEAQFTPGARVSKRSITFACVRWRWKALKLKAASPVHFKEYL
ncbi:hypothetical protein ACNKHM_19730 [Shigella sonnei]